MISENISRSGIQTRGFLQPEADCTFQQLPSDCIFSAPRKVPAGRENLRLSSCSACVCVCARKTKVRFATEMEISRASEAVTGGCN